MRHRPPISHSLPTRPHGRLTAPLHTCRLQRLCPPSRHPPQPSPRLGPPTLPGSIRPGAPFHPINVHFSRRHGPISRRPRHNPGPPHTLHNLTCHARHAVNPHLRSLAPDAPSRIDPTRAAAVTPRASRRNNIQPCVVRVFLGDAVGDAAEGG